MLDAGYGEVLPLKQIDLNCDMGESFGPWQMGQDTAIMPYITSANVACGLHAGDPSVMEATIRLAKEHGVAVGAHPGYPDLQGFGRRVIPMGHAEIRSYVLYQIGALWAIARRLGVELTHVKAHGALYNIGAADRQVALSLAEAVAGFSKEVSLFCLPGSELELAARELGLKVIGEGFVDRAYEPNGSLVDRKKPASVYSDPKLAADQALQLAAGGVTCKDGSHLALEVSTLCLHGDNSVAPDIARLVREALDRAGYKVTANR